MCARHIVAIACVALLILSASAGADELGPPEPAAPEPVAAGPAEAPAPTATATPAAPPAPIPTAVPEATPEATPAPDVQETPAVEATPAPTPTAVFESAADAEATPGPTVMAGPVGEATAAEEATPARAARVAVAAQEPPPEPTPPPGECATPVEPLDGVEEAPSVDGECRVLAAVCSILGTDSDDVLTGSPFDDIICGLGGNDRLDGGDGDDVLLGGEGDDELVGGEGDDCMVGGPGSDRAENTEGESPEVEQSANIDSSGGLSEQYAHDITFDAAGRCTGAGSFSIVAGGMTAVPRIVAPTVPPPAGAALDAVAASSSASGGLRLGLRDRRLAVREGVVRVHVSCSAEVGAELVLLAGSRRIARKRFTCTPPDEKVRVRLNRAGRKLVAEDDRVQARLLVLAGGRAVSRHVQLVSPGG